jgi:hypothetical protein
MCSIFLNDNPACSYCGKSGHTVREHVEGFAYPQITAAEACLYRGYKDAHKCDLECNESYAAAPQQEQEQEQAPVEASPAATAIPTTAVAVAAADNMSSSVQPGHESEKEEGENPRAAAALRMLENLITQAEKEVGMLDYDFETEAAVKILKLISGFATLLADLDGVDDGVDEDKKLRFKICIVRLNACSAKLDKIATAHLSKPQQVLRYPLAIPVSVPGPVVATTAEKEEEEEEEEKEKEEEEEDEGEPSTKAEIEERKSLLEHFKQIQGAREGVIYYIPEAVQFARALALALLKIFQLHTNAHQMTDDLTASTKRLCMELVRFSALSRVDPEYHHAHPANELQTLVLHYDPIRVWIPNDLKSVLDCTERNLTRLLDHYEGDVGGSDNCDEYATLFKSVKNNLPWDIKQEKVSPVLQPFVLEAASMMFDLNWDAHDYMHFVTQLRGAFSKCVARTRVRFLEMKVKMYAAMAAALNAEAATGTTGAGPAATAAVSVVPDPEKAEKVEEKKPPM